MPKKKPPKKFITEVFDEFLSDQKARRSPGTYTKYESIIRLFKIFLNNCWPNHDGQYDRVTKAGGTFCSTYGTNEIATHFGMFLGYVVLERVIGGSRTETSARSVIRKLANWLVAKGYDPEAIDHID